MVLDFISLHDICPNVASVSFYSVILIVFPQLVWWWGSTYGNTFVISILHTANLISLCKTTQDTLFGHESCPPSLLEAHTFTHTHTHTYRGS